jgi:hypothetical protein
MFWPVIVALGVAGSAAFYDGDGGADTRSYPDRAACESAIHALTELARADGGFRDAVEGLADDGPVDIGGRCVDKPPARYLREDLASPPRRGNRS